MPEETTVVGTLWRHRTQRTTPRAPPCASPRHRRSAAWPGCGSSSAARRDCPSGHRRRTRAGPSRSSDPPESEHCSPSRAAVIVARRVGEEGFLTYVKALHRLGVLQHPELLNWLALHGHVLRATEPPLDAGDGLPDYARSRCCSRTWTGDRITPWPRRTGSSSRARSSCSAARTESPPAFKVITACTSCSGSLTLALRVPGPRGAVRSCRGCCAGDGMTEASSAAPRCSTCFGRWRAAEAFTPTSLDLSRRSGPRPRHVRGRRPLPRLGSTTRRKWWIADLMREAEARFGESAYQVAKRRAAANAPC